MAYLSTNERGLESKSFRGRNQPSFSYLLVLIFLTFPHVSRAQFTGSDENINQVSATKAQPSGDVPHVKLRLTETVSSANARVGQLVSVEVVDPVRVDGRVIIAPGAHARASVTSAKRRGRNHGEGQLLTVESVSRVDGTEALLQSATVQKGSGHGPPIFGPCTFPLPADPAGLFRKGNNVVIPKGTELIAVIAPSSS